MDLFINNLASDPLFFFSVVFTVVLSIVIHELCHGFAAVALGDRTPILSGHMTADPLVHMGPWSLVALAVAGIAWGQMPIDPTRLRGRYAESLVALAGPASNLVLAAVALTGLGVWLGQEPYLFMDPAMTDGDPFWRNAQQFLLIFGATNLGLCLFNLLPVPPLDGSHVLGNFHRGYGQFISDPGNGGVIMILFVMAFGLGSFLFGKAIEWSGQYVTWVSGLG
jgi:Zn-dependent protease